MARKKVRKYKVVLKIVKRYSATVEFEGKDLPTEEQLKILAIDKMNDDRGKTFGALEMIVMHSERIDD